MTTDETGKQYVYDAWNRLKVLKNSGGTTLKTYVSDALGRRVAEIAGGATTDLYYSADWQVLEERDAARTNDTKARYVWSPVYVDAMALRDRDTADDGTLEERLWVQQDANFNVTALTNSSGTVVERYAYDPYGVATVLNASWSSIGGSAYSWQYLHQGGRLDVISGLYHFRNRDYSSNLGRWITKDPINYDGLDTLLYRYVSNSPINARDYSGLVNPQEVGWAIAHIGCAEGANRGRIAVENRLQDRYSKKNEGADNHVGNAVKHCTWMCVTSLKCSPKAAWWLGVAHEVGTENNSIHSMTMDIWNNFSGIQIAEGLIKNSNDGGTTSDQVFKCLSRCEQAASEYRLYWFEQPPQDFPDKGITLPINGWDAEKNLRSGPSLPQDYPNWTLGDKDHWIKINPNKPTDLPTEHSESKKDKSGSPKPPTFR